MLATISKSSIEHKTDLNTFYIDSYITYLPVKDVQVDYESLATKCKEACKNYNKKYSCPPCAPSFDTLKKGYHYLVVNALRTDIKEFREIYNTIRMTNNVMKSIQRRVMDSTFDNKELILENGSCRRCKKCMMEMGTSCKHPEKMKYSLEATGVYVNDLTIKCFSFPLVWYTQANFPDYQCVVSGVLTNDPEAVLEKLNYSYKNLITR